MIYRAYGRLIESEIDLPAGEASGRADLRLALGDVLSSENGWTNVWEPTERAPWVRVRREGPDYTIRYERQVDFHYSPDDRAILTVVHDCPSEPLGHFAMDQVLPLVLSLEALVLHASAVVIDDVAVACCGAGGCGKSTLALMLERQGYPILADDALLVRCERGRVVATPSYAGLRFWPDIAALVGRLAPVDQRAARKLRVSDGLAFHDRPVVLEQLLIVDVRDSTEPSFEPLSVRETVMALVANSYRLEQHDRALLAAELDRAVGVSANVSGCRFCYPRGQAAWRDIAAAVVAHVRAAAASSRRTSPCCR